MTDILKNKNCLITGATGALGSELAKQLYEKGCNLYLTGTNYDKLQKLVLELTENNDNRGIFYYKCDFTSLSSVKDLIESIDQFLEPDILINSAGIFSINEIDDIKDLDLERHLNINVKVPYLLCRYFSQGMKKRKWGKIINVGSSSSYTGFKGGSLYCMTKHAILGMSRALHEEFKKYNIQVSCVSPSSMKSEMAKISVDQDFSTFLEPKDVAEQIVNVLCMENNMTCKELRLDRVIMK